MSLFWPPLSERESRPTGFFFVNPTSSQLSVLLNLSARGDIIRKSSPSLWTTSEQLPQKQDRCPSHGGGHVKQELAVSLPHEIWLVLYLP